MKRLIWILIGCLLLPGIASAETLLLKNGNEISGVIEAIDDEQIVMGIPGAGSVIFKRSEVVGIREEVLEGLDYTDAVYLKNGNVILGDIQDKRNGEVYIDVPDTGILTFRDAEILTIEQVSPEQAAELRDKQTVSMMPTDFSYEEESGTGFAEQIKAWVQSRVLEGDTSDPRQISTNIINLVAEISMWFILGAFALAIYHAVCLHTLAGRTGNGAEWMAWVPLLHIYLACEVGGRPPWWILLYLISIVGGVVGFFPLLLLAPIADVVTWWGISTARGKPGWLGATVVLWPLGLITIGYLAFCGDADAGQSKEI